MEKELKNDLLILLNELESPISTWVESYANNELMKKLCADKLREILEKHKII